MAALTLGLSFKALIASSLYFPTKIGSTVPNCQNLFIRQVVRTARISILEKLNDDCMTKRKTDHFKAITSSCHASAIADHVTSTGHNLKWDHFDILAKGRSDTHCKIKETNKGIETHPK